jgi:hypothetical protein
VTAKSKNDVRVGSAISASVFFHSTFSILRTTGAYTPSLSLTMPPGVAVVDAFKSNNFILFVYHTFLKDHLFQISFGMARITYIFVRTTLHRQPRHLPIHMQTINVHNRNAVSRQMPNPRPNRSSSSSNPPRYNLWLLSNRNSIHASQKRLFKKSARPRRKCLPIKA